MSDIDTLTTPHLSPMESMRRMLPALLLFSVVLLGLLAISWTMVLPRYTSLDVGGNVLAASAVPAYARQLEEQIAAAETRRDELTLPLRDAAYVALRDEVKNAPSFADIEQQLRSMLARTDYGENVFFVSMSMDDAGMELEGDVRDAGPSSVTLLGRFVDDLAAQPFVAELIPPPFTRVDDPQAGIRSPFVIRFSVR